VPEVEEPNEKLGLFAVAVAALPKRPPDAGAVVADGACPDDAFEVGVPKLKTGFDILGKLDTDSLLI
jgi:hypothetical protein